MVEGSAVFETSGHAEKATATILPITAAMLLLLLVSLQFDETVELFRHLASW